MKKRALQLQPFFMIAILIINLTTTLYTNIFSQNLSDLGNSLHHPFLMLLWASTAACYFGYYTMILLNKYEKKEYLLKAFIIVSCICMILSVIIPYAPKQLPILAKWHVRLAMFATITYALSFFFVLQKIQKHDILLFQQILHPYCLLVILCGFLYLLLGGVTTLLEITFTIGMSIYLYMILKNE